MQRLRAILARPWLHCTLLLTLGFIVRMPALQGALIWDDHWLVKGNPFVKSPLLAAEAFRHYLFLDGTSAHYRPLQLISYSFDYLFWNTDAYGYHLSNILLHLTSGLLLYFLLRKLIAQLLSVPNECKSHALAFLIALLWLVHPVHSAAVDYISGRADSLAFLFASSGWLLVLRGRRQHAPRTQLAHYAFAAVCALLSLCAREIGFVWICLFLLHLLVFEKQTARRTKLIAIASCVLLLVCYVTLRQLPHRAIAAAHENGAPAPVRATLMLRALGDYARLMVCPTRLCMERTLNDLRNYRNTTTWRDSIVSEYLSVLGLIFAAALAYGATRKGAGRPLRLFGALWFLCGYLPISNIVDLNANVAEHWLYLPSVGFFIFVAGVALDLPRFARQISVAFACLAVCGFSARAYVRSSDWVTPKTFFQRTIAGGGASTRAAVNLAIIYGEEGNYAKAEALYRRVLELVPDYPIARNGLADALYHQGKRAEGEALFDSVRVAATETRHEFPTTWIAALNLARIRHHDGDDAASLALLERARIDYPQTWEIISFEAEVVRQTKGPDAALRLIAEFARDNWWHRDASVSLGRLLFEKGDTEAAVDAFRFASWLDVHDAQALNLIALIRQRQGRFAEAHAAQRRAVSRQPDEPRQYRLLGEILRQMGRTADAQLALAKVASLESIAQSHLTAN